MAHRDDWTGRQDSYSVYASDHISQVIMNPHGQYYSTTNTREASGEYANKKPYCKKYQRANSYDESRFVKRHRSEYYGPFSTATGGYTASFVYGAPYVPFYTGPVISINKPIDDMYRSSPILNYSANSYYGWHNNKNQATTLPRNMHCTNPATSTVKQTVTFDQDDSVPMPYCSSSTYRPNPVNIDKEIIGLSPNGNNISGNDLLKTTHSPLSSMESQESPDDTGEARRRSVFGNKSRRIKLCIVISILVIIIAVVIAMGVAVYSQVKSQSSALKLVRQFRGSFVVVGGQLLEFDADLLNSHSSAFKHKAKVYERKIDAVFRESGLAAIYEGAEVVSFQFVDNYPVMEVFFNVRTKVNVQLQVAEMLTVFEEAIKKNVGAAFSDVAIDPSSLTIENQHSEKYKPHKQANSASETSFV